MSYDSKEQGQKSGEPFFLYRFSTSGNDTFLTSERDDYVRDQGLPEEQVYATMAISHGRIKKTGDLERVPLSVTMPLSNDFAAGFLAKTGTVVTSVTIFRGHRNDLDSEIVVVWKGRVMSAKAPDNTVDLNCESIHTSMRRSGLRARYTRKCRHVLYGGKCGLDLDAHYDAASATGYSGDVLTLSEAAAQADGWYAGGVLKFGDFRGFITKHVGTQVTVRRMPSGLLHAIDLDPTPVEIAPGCDLLIDTCDQKYGNHFAHGGFPDMPRLNPFIVGLK